MNATKKIVFIIAIVVAFLVISFQGGVSALVHIGVGDVAYLSFLTYITIILSGYVFSVLLAVLGVNLKHQENVHLAVAAQFLNYFGPVRAGALVKAVYLKRKYSFLYTNYASVAIANALISMATLSVIGIVALLTLSQEGEAYYLIVVCLICIFAAILPLLLKRRMDTVYGKLGKVGRALLSAHDGFVLIAKMKKNMLIEVFLVVVQALLSAYIYMYAFTSFGMNMSYMTALIVSVFASLSTLFSVTPGNIGVQEFIVASLSQLVGPGFVGGAAVAAILRVIHLTIVCAHAPWSLAWLSVTRSSYTRTVDDGA